MRVTSKLIPLTMSVFVLFALLGVDVAVAQNVAGDLLWHNPRTVSWLIQDRIVPLPLNGASAVDLTAQMPPVGNQGSQRSCAAWAMGYYHKTHNEWVEHHWNDGLAKNQASPAFVYNQIDGGQDQGSYFEDAGKLMCEQGAGNMAEMPFNQGDCTTWPAESTYLHAISWRCDSCYWIDISNDVGVDRVKARLDSGYTTTLGIWVWRNFDSIRNYSYTYCKSQRTGNNRGRHAVTFVGYDDSKPTADGLGAFKLVNSWGTGWGQAGYFWMSYQAVEDADTSAANGLTQGVAYYVSDKIGYTPTLLARVQLTHQYRDAIKIRLGVGPSNAPLWTKDFRQFRMVDSETTVPRPFPDNNMVFDMTEGASYIAEGHADLAFVRCLDDTSDGRSGWIDYFSAQYLPWSVTGVSGDPPVSIPDYNVAAYA